MMHLLVKTFGSSVATLASLRIVMQCNLNELLSEFSPMTNLMLHEDAKPHHKADHGRWITPTKAVAFATDREIVVERVSTAEITRDYMIRLPSFSEPTTAYVAGSRRLCADYGALSRRKRTVWICFLMFLWSSENPPNVRFLHEIVSFDARGLIKSRKINVVRTLFEAIRPHYSSTTYSNTRNATTRNTTSYVTKMLNQFEISENALP